MECMNIESLSTKSSRSVYEVCSDEKLFMAECMFKGDSTYFCRACYANVTESSLKAHLLKHHLITDETLGSQTCDSCVKCVCSVENRANYAAHVGGNKHITVKSRQLTFDHICPKCCVPVKDKKNHAKGHHELVPVVPPFGLVDEHVHVTPDDAVVEHQRKTHAARFEGYSKATHSVISLLARDAQPADAKGELLLSNVFCIEHLTEICRWNGRTQINSLNKCDAPQGSVCVVCANITRLLQTAPPQRPVHRYTFSKEVLKKVATDATHDAQAVRQMELEQVYSDHNLDIVDNCLTPATEQLTLEDTQADPETTCQALPQLPPIVEEEDCTLSQDSMESNCESEAGAADGRLRVCDCQGNFIDEDIF
jgi:hypothetical protein